LTICKPVSFSRRTVLYGVSKYVSKYAKTSKISELEVKIG
jgi:hypothetical protein